MQGLAENDLRHILSRKSGGSQPPESQPEQRAPEQRAPLSSKLGTVRRSEPEPHAHTERAPRRVVEIEEQQPARYTRQSSRNR